MYREKLERVAGTMAAYPENVDISVWSKGRLILDKGIAPMCGTTGCIAGFALALEHGQFSNDDDNTYPSRDAAEVLGLTHDQMTRLFYSHNWPIEYQMKYNQAISPSERANAVVERIHDFLRTE